MFQFQDVSRKGTLLVVLSLVLGIAALVSLAPSANGVEPTISMASMPHTATMSSLSMLPGKSWNSMQSQRQFLQPAEATKRDLMNGAALAGLAAVVPKEGAFAVSPVDIKDDRAAVGKGIDIIYEARELDLPQNVRDGFTQAREGGADFAKKRIGEMVTRLDNSVLPSIEKAYWSEAKNELRRQLGSLRFDLNTLAEGNKEAMKARKTALLDIEKLDAAIQGKNKELALKRFPVAMASIDATLKLV